MYSNNKYDGINPLIVSIVRCKVYQLINHQYFSKNDFQDLEQELIIEVLNKLVNYNPDKSSLSTFVKRITRDKAINLITHRLAQKNDYKISIHSLYEPITGNNEEQTCLLIDIISSNATFYDYDDFDSIEQMNIEFEIEVKQILKTLPNDLYNLYELLQYKNINEILRHTGMSRRTFYRKLKILKKIFANYKYQ